jgi:hypothetical protein
MGDRYLPWQLSPLPLTTGYSPLPPNNPHLTLATSLDLQLFPELRQDLEPFLRYHPVILNSNPADSREVKSWFNRQNLTRLEVCLRDPWLFVNRESKSVAQAVEKTNPPAVSNFCGISLLPKKFSHFRL